MPRASSPSSRPRGCSGSQSRGQGAAQGHRVEARKLLEMTERRPGGSLRGRSKGLRRRASFIKRKYTGNMLFSKQIPGALFSHFVPHPDRDVVFATLVLESGSGCRLAAAAAACTVSAASAAARAVSAASAAFVAFPDLSAGDKDQQGY